MKSRLDEILPFINMNETTSKPLDVYEFEGVEFLRKAALELKLLKVYQDSKLYVENVPKRFKINNIVFFKFMHIRNH